MAKIVILPSFLRRSLLLSCSFFFVAWKFNATCHRGLQLCGSSCWLLLDDQVRKRKFFIPQNVCMDKVVGMEKIWKIEWDENLFYFFWEYFSAERTKPLFFRKWEGRKIEKVVDVFWANLIKISELNLKINWNKWKVKYSLYYETNEKWNAEFFKEFLPDFLYINPKIHHFIFYHPLLPSITFFLPPFQFIYSSWRWHVTW